LIANPNDFTLTNNYTYAAAQLNLLEDAEKEFSRIDEKTLSTRNKIVWLATSGLMKYRAGQSVEGRTLYMESINLAKNDPDPKLGCLALINLALEEIRIDSDGAETCRKAAVEKVGQLPFADLKPLSARLKQ